MSREKEKKCSDSSLIGASAECSNANVSGMRKTRGGRESEGGEASFNRKPERGMERTEGGRTRGGPDEGTKQGAARSKMKHSSLHSYLGKEGFALPRRDGEMEGGGEGEMRRPLREMEEGRRGDEGRTDQEEEKKEIYHKNPSPGA